MNAYNIGVKLAVAELSETEKRAFWGALAKGGLLAAREAWPLLSKGFMAAARPVGTALEGGIGKGLWAAARSPLGKDMIGGGLIGGTLNAYNADPGDRMGAFAKGFGYGAVGGAVNKGLTSGMGALGKTAPMQQWLGQRAATGLGRFGKGAVNFGLNNSWGRGIGAGVLTMGMPTGSEPKPQPLTNIPGYY